MPLDGHVLGTNSGLSGVTISTKWFHDWDSTVLLLIGIKFPSIREPLRWKYQLIELSVDPEQPRVGVNCKYP